MEPISEATRRTIESIIDDLVTIAMSMPECEALQRRINALDDVLMAQAPL